MHPEEAAERVRAACLRRPDLCWSKWPKVGSVDLGKVLPPYSGYCYIATMAFCSLVEEARPFRDEGKTHFWPQIGMEIWDITKDQFNGIEFPYHVGQQVPRRMTKRTQELLKECFV